MQGSYVATLNPFQKAHTVQILSSQQFEAIHFDFRGEWSGISGNPEWIGRRTAMSGSIGLPLGFLAIEGQDFLIDDARGRHFFPVPSSASN